MRAGIQSEFTRFLRRNHGANGVAFMLIRPEHGGIIPFPDPGKSFFHNKTITFTKLFLLAGQILKWC
jgi:hypothetical protein